jgi:hypothetical protein
MTGKEFLNSVAKGRSDILQVLLDILSETGSRYCVIGGLAVNAYVEPVVSLDVGIVVAVEGVEAVAKAAAGRGLRIEHFEHSINISGSGSDLRIQVQTDRRYQSFMAAAEERDVLGYRMKVARLEDVLQGKVWAFGDPARRKSKRQKDLADVARIIEAFPDLAHTLPRQVQDQLRE